MTSQTNEQALEAAIEKRLTGYCLEELKEPENVGAERRELYKAGNDFNNGYPSAFSVKYGIYIFQFEFLIQYIYVNSF